MLQGINMTALREIKLLREIDNPFIVRLLDVFPHKRNLSLVCRSPLNLLLYVTAACKFGQPAIQLHFQADECFQAAYLDSWAYGILGERLG